MSAARAELQDRFIAAFLGLAIGDALGFPLRGVPAAALRRLPELAEDFSPRPRGRFPQGQYSEHTQLAVLAAESMCDAGAVDGRRFAERLLKAHLAGAVVQPSPAVADAAERLGRGMPWMTSGAVIGVRDASCLSRGIAIGLFETDALRMARYADVLSVVTHKDPTCAAASAALARALAEIVAGASSPSHIAQQMANSAAAHDPALGEELRQLPRLLSWDLDRALALLGRVGVPVEQVEAADGVTAHPWPALLLGTYAAFRLPHDFREAMAAVLRCGGEVSAAAGVAGALLGAAQGCNALPPRLRRHVLDGPRLFAVARSLLDARARRSESRPAAG